MRFFILFLCFLVPITINAQKRVAIVGGGMAGVAAAHQLLQLDSNIEVHLFEKAAQLGGNAQSHRFKHNGQDIAIDIGPQYFAKGAWDTYIALLKEYQLLDKKDVHRFKASIAIQDAQNQKDIFLSPKGGLKRLQLKSNLKFLKFYNAARDVYGDKIAYDKNLGKWVDQLDLDSSFKSQVVLPFLASSLGTSIIDIRNCSTQDIVKLFAFQKATKGNTFQVLDQGMGGAIIKMGKVLVQKGLQLHLNTPVIGIEKTGSHWIINSTDGKSEKFTHCIIATHADQCAKILPDTSSFDDLRKALKGLTYFKAHIVLHSDTSYVAQDKSASFFNVQYDVRNQKIVSNTMNLGFINEAWKGVYKSWLNDEQVKLLKNQGAFIHEVVFDHPMITYTSVQNIKRAMQLVQNLDDLYIIGGWSLGLETQESATISGFRAAQSIFESK